jgi:hypothetical protein
VRRATLQREVTSAVIPRLQPGEDVVGAAAVWVTTPRNRLQRAVSARRLLPAAITEQRLVLFRRPEKGTIEGGGIALEVPLAHLRVDGVGRLPLWQVRLRAGRTREIVVEFRPRDRWLGRELVHIIENPAAATSRAPSASTPANAPDLDG